MVVHNTVDTSQLNPLSANSESSSFKRKFLQFIAIMGPGLIVMLGDNDAGGVGTYGQAGQNYGLSLLWVLLLLLPVLVVNQEMVVRLGAVTGVGHAKLIFRRFGFWWGLFSAGDLFILNFLTIVTEFIGITLFADYFHFPRKTVVILSMIILITIVTTGSFYRWEKVMLIFVALAFIQIPMLLLSKPDFAAIGEHLVLPTVQGGLTNDSILLIIAMVGTTVAPWQLFFQQSSVVDKNIKSKDIKLARWDTYVGAGILLVGAISLLVTSNYAAEMTHTIGQFSDAGTVASLLHSVKPVLGNIYGIVLLDASIIGAAAISVSTSYAFGDVFGITHSLNKKFTEAKSFYISYMAMVLLAGFLVIIPDSALLGLINTLVQALAGLLLPSASVFLLLLCNDKGVLGPWVNKLWINVLAVVIIVILIDLSAILMISTVFPNWDGIKIASYVGVISVVLCAFAAIYYGIKVRSGSTKAQAVEALDYGDKLEWHMPPIDELQPAMWNYGTKLAMYALRGYLILGAILLVIKGIQLAA